MYKIKLFAKKVTREQMQQLIGRRGPVPRLVLDYAHHDGADAETQNAIGEVEASDIKAARPDTTQASHRLVLIHPPGWRQGDFTNHVLTFLSTAHAKLTCSGETRATGLGKQAIKELVDKDVALVERRLAACETQFKMAVPVTCCAAPDPPQTPVQGGPRASLSTASSMAKSTACAVLGPRPGLQIFRNAVPSSAFV
ncbi:hypothetical protein CVIRNUC_001760 [Coccomyxa viridis]|uniref:Uncharacterized protein n=1 Tax=Coccomyxa viridis TaxID=1274662 RepID=A0AAV1HWW3_9CHLO|nr:hypothetical protein CVIRNUC_001760 [Coccomyxa viridis]